MAIQLSEILNLCDELLQPWLFQDYCPNGLQVEGCMQVEKIVTGVSASQALIEAAIKQGGQAIIVHHGYFWKGDDPRVQGILRKRLALLLKHNISLIVFHLPLDAQADFGNNIQLAKLLGIEVSGGMEAGKDPSIGLVGKLNSPMTGDEFAELLQLKLNRKPLYIPGTNKPIETIAWCTGAAQDFIQRAMELGVDAYLTGEVSEPTVHLARESGVHFFSAGHHATERYGVQALGNLLAERLGLEHSFIDIDNPV